MADATESEAEQRLSGEIRRILDESRQSQALHNRKLKELASLHRSSPADLFFRAFFGALAPLFDFPRRTICAERSVRFAASFVSLISGKSGGTVDPENPFLEQFLRLLLSGACSAHRPARFRSCQIISEIIMRLPDNAEVSDEAWDEVIEGMKVRIGDKIPGIRAFAVRALSRFADDESDIVDLFLEALPVEQNPDVRKTIILSLPPSSATLEVIVEATLDVSGLVRRAAHCVLASKFPLQALSIKHRTMLLNRGLKDRSPPVVKECLRMLKEEWLMKCCGGDPVALLKYLDVETYESVGEAVMEAFLNDGVVHIQEGQSIREYISSENQSEAECTPTIRLISPEAALYWKVVCKHLHAEAQAKGTDAATTTGTEAAVYASEASDKNDLLERVLPGSISDYVALVKAHLSAGPNYHFVSRQLLLLGTMLDFSDSTNRKTASAFLRELLLVPPECEADEFGIEISVGDGLSLGGDREWARAMSELAKKVHASTGEFEEVLTHIIEEQVRPCRERTANFTEWMHCLSLVGFLLENIDGLWILRGKAIGATELLNSLLLPAAKQTAMDVQRSALRYLGLFGMLERRPSTELVRQLYQSFIKGSPPVSAMACKALLDLVAWHGPHELNKAIGLDPDVKKTSISPVHTSDCGEDACIDVLDLLYSGFDRDDSELEFEGGAEESIIAVLGEGFAKLLLLCENYPSISVELCSVILSKLITLYFSEESGEFQRLRQCLSIFFEHFPALSHDNKASNKAPKCFQYALRMFLFLQSNNPKSPKLQSSFVGPFFPFLFQRCVSCAFLPVLRRMWPGMFGNNGGSSIVVSKLRKRAALAARFMLQMMQTPLFSKDNEEHSEDCFDCGEEGLAIRIAVEVACCRERAAAAKAYISTLCKMLSMLRFRASEQKAIKFLRGMLNVLICRVYTNKDLVKDLTKFGTVLKTLDKCPSEDLPDEEVIALLEKLGIQGGIQWDINMVPPTPVPPSAKAPPSRARTRCRQNSSDDGNSDMDDDGRADGSNSYLDVPSTNHVLVTPSLASMRSQRASKTAALAKMAAKSTAFQSLDSDDDLDAQSGLTDEDS
ncbi:condensin complex subunit 3 [Carex littledalei]|uniref:Condensin complex subunit 3 n=1 Tax=Carex littledalei TaxID=544730 RepID=A0A833VAX0_9POAL|nr:condensin complex subunit 3 [Carex littledalei]